MNKVIKEVEVYDSDHIFMDGRQYVSFSKMCKNREKYNNELMWMDEKIIQLESENNALKVLLKEKLVKEGAE